MILFIYKKNNSLNKLNEKYPIHISKIIILNLLR